MGGTLNASRGVYLIRGLLPWLLFIMWAGLVLGLSSQSSPPGAQFIRFQLEGRGDVVYHLVSYLVGGYLAYMVAAFVSPGARWPFRYVLALFLSLLVAVVDESIQRFVPDRTSSALDIGVDALGTVSALVLATVAAWLYRRLRGNLRST